MSRTTSLKRATRSFLATPTGLLSALALTGLIVLAIIGPHGFGTTATTVDMVHASEGPSAEHLLGTDGLGRDILLRTLAATRLSLLLGASAVALAAVAGCLIGALLAVAGRRIRQFGATVIDTMLSFGDILLGVVIVTILGLGARSAVIAIGVAFTPIFARFSFSLVSSVVARDYVAAARVIGVRRRSFLSRYVFRNVSDSLAVTVFSAVGEGIIALSSLSFLGLGVQEPDFDWGQMLTDGVRNFYLNPWAAVAPALMIGLTGLALSMFGDALARALNPIVNAPTPNGPAEVKS
jgi:ABC-type dipeptide/oligopeptide/nickel transport system permease subunit